MNRDYEADSDDWNRMMLEAMKNMPLRSLVTTSRGALTDDKLDELLKHAAPQG